MSSVDINILNLIIYFSLKIIIFIPILIVHNLFANFTFNALLSLMTLNIIWASMYGTAQGVAYQLKEKAEAKGANVNICEMDDFEISNLGNIEYLAVISSTTGSGDVPVNGENFWSDLQNVSSEYPNLNFAVCALGDITYENFCGAGNAIKEKLLQLNAKEIINICELDGGDDGAEEWCDSLLKKIY